jgi:hypothetical protein
MPALENCYGCNHITRRCDGSCITVYGCAFSPGLVTGMVGAFEDDEPKACNRHTQSRETPNMLEDRKIRIIPAE